ncbi:MAG: LacI family transcription regulator [Microbacterium sp.]|nr:LacI family transcription regulator [Microbacterium sp.]
MSLVVNGKAEGRVSAALVARVRAAVDELGYVVDQSASTLSSGSTRTIVMVAPDPSNPYYGSVISGVKEGLGAHYQLLLSITESGRQPDASDIRGIIGLRIAGLLVGAPSPRFLTDLPIPIPTVLVDSDGTDRSVPSVNLAAADGARALAEHLAMMGHKRVAYIDNETGSATFAARREAFWETAARIGLQVVEPAAYATVDTIDAAADAFRECWPAWRRSRATAVVCSTDTQAYGVLWEANALGVRIPDQLAVAGFDDLPYSRVSNPSLTTVALPGRELGREAARALRSLLEGADVSPRVRTLPAQLIERQSTAARF